MAEYNKKWANLFPATIGNQTRPSAGVDNTLQYETDKFPQHIANDPVRYDKMNAVVSQSMSNDERLNEKIKRTSDDLATHNKDPKAHATGISGNAATATKVVTTAANGASANIAEATMASNDFARIRVSGANNTGELALETSDDGSEPIVARQYTGVYANVVRTAKILDEGGNTSFPGTVVAPKFTGSLNGNAATATKLATARTISLTGNASGNATFDGSGNTNINTTVNAINNQGNKTAIKDGTAEPSGLKLYEVYNNGYPTSYGNLISIGGLGGGELLAGWSPTDHGVEHLYYRNRRDNGKLWSNWSTILDSANYNSFAPTKTGGGASGNWGINISGNAASASKLSTARKINITGDATGSANFDGSGNVSINTTVNESKHAATATALNIFTSRLSDANMQKGDGLVRYFLATASMKSNKPMKDASILHLAWDNNGGWDTQLAITSVDANIQARSQNSGTWGDWKTFLDEKNYTDYAPTKNGTGATGTWDINITGNAAKATNANNADKLTSESGSNYLTIDTDENSWSVIGPNPGAWLKSIRTNNKAPAYSIGSYSAAIAFGIEDTKGIITHAFGTPNVKFAGGNGSTARWKFSIYGGFNNEVYDLNDFPTKTGGGASGTWGINITGNAASATTATKANTATNATNATNAKNADTVDGYHASDLLRILGGNRTPVITDIFDRAGTIDMSTMSAADKATHKANINKASNMTQNIWNNSTGIHAYGGDTDISGFPISTLKLTQSWRNFDKLMILYTDDGGNWGRVRTFDVYEFNYCMTNMHSFNILLSNGQSWHVYGLTKHGTDSDFKPSTETILSCRSQNCGIIGIYGIKF